MIGCGRVARDLHLPAWRTLPQARLIALCDSSPAVLDNLGTHYPQAHRFLAPDDLIAIKDELDFAVVATPGIAHATQCERLLEHGIPVLCEKPLTLDFVSAQNLFAIADRRKVALCPIHNYRFKGNVVKAVGMHRENRFGDIEFVSVRFRSGSLFDEPAHWMRDERKYRALLFEIAYHFVDLALMFAGPVASMTTLDADVDNMGLRYVTFSTIHRNGGRGQFELRVDAKCRSTEIEVFGEKGGFSLQFFPDGYRTLPYRDSPAHRCLAEAVRLAHFVGGRSREKLHIGIPRRAIPHARLFAAFLESLGGRAPLPVSRDDALMTIKLLDQAASRAYGVGPYEQGSEQYRECDLT